MKKIALCFFLVLLAGFRLNGDERISETILNPKIHQGLWPNFCLYHLQHDPKGCSAWGEGKEHPLGLELDLYGYSHAHIDEELYARLGHLVDYIPANNNPKNKLCKCGHGTCSRCHQTVIYGVDCSDEDYIDDDPQSYVYYLIKRCGCESTGDCEGINWVEKGTPSSWHFCSSPTIYSGYLDWNNKIYFHNLKNLLFYIEDNSVCKCYWPQINSQACLISDLVHDELGKILTPFYTNELYVHFSPRIEFNKAASLKYICYVFGQKYPYKEGGKRTLQEILSSLLTHAFFYTHYRDILLDFDQFAFKELPAEKNQMIQCLLMDLEEQIHPLFLDLYSQCLERHAHPKIYYERGMVLFHRGEHLDSLDDIRKFISYAENNHYDELLTSDLYFKEGRLLSESLSYDEAIVSLTKAIEKDPKNSEAYFERAFAYFETGNFEVALSDYLASGIGLKKVDPVRVGKFNYVTLGQGIALGMLQGGQDAATEFVPSMLSCFRGMSRGLWAFVSNPITLSQDLIDSAYACVEFIQETSAKEILGKLVPELQECLARWPRLDDYTKGKYIGRIIGKYGVDIFIGAGSIKAIRLYKNLRTANALMTLETASVSPKLAREVLEQAVKEEAIRNKILKSGNLKIRWDRQGKHIKGHKNYVAADRRSILTHEDPQKLINKYAGTGRRVGHGTPGKPGYKEIVDFEENIGYFIDVKTGESFITSRGSIDYAKNGVHIVPRAPG